MTRRQVYGSLRAVGHLLGSSSGRLSGVVLALKYAGLSAQDERAQIFEAGNWRYQVAVDDQRGRAGYALLAANLDLRTDPTLVAVAIYAGIERVAVEAQFGCGAFQVGWGEDALSTTGGMREQHVVVGPELALLVGAFGSRCCPYGFIAQKSHVAIDEAHPAVRYERLLQLGPLTKGEALAAGSLEVGPLLNHDWSCSHAHAVHRPGGKYGRAWSGQQEQSKARGNNENRSAGEKCIHREISGARHVSLTSSPQNTSPHSFSTMAP
jgi:hypothetical protein